MAASSSSGSLNARLTLTGSDDVKRQLEDVGNAGEKSLGKINEGGHAEGLESIEQAAEGISQAFEGLSNFTSLGGIAGIFEGIAGAVGKFNVVLGAGLAVITGASAGLFELAESGAKFASEIKDGATRVGVAAKDYASLRFAFEQSASSAEDFEKAMGVILEASQTADNSAQNVTDAANKIVNDEARIKVAAEATQDAWRTRASTLSEISIKSGQDITAINLQFSRADDAARKLNGDAETTARKKAQDDRIESIRVLNLRIAEEQRLANKAYSDAQAKISRDNRKQFNDDLDAYHKAANDAATAATGAAKKFADLGVVLKDSADKARDPAEVFRDIADKIGEIEDPATKSAKAIDLFGRRFGSKLVEALSEGRDALKKLEDEAKDLNIIPDPKELDIGKKFDDEIAKLSSVVKAASGRVGLVFAPLFGEVVDALATVLGHAIPSLIAGAQTIAGFLKPVFDDVTNVILGNTDKVKSQFISVLVKAVGYFVEAVKIAGGVIGDVLGAMVTAFNFLDGVVQSIFGGASLGGIAGFLVSIRAMLAVVGLIDLALSVLVTGPLVAMITAFSSLIPIIVSTVGIITTLATGTLSVLTTALAPVVTAFTAIAAVIGWPALLIIGLGLLVAALLGFTNTLDVAKGNFSALWELIKAFAGYIVGNLVTNIGVLVTAFQTGWATIYYWISYYMGLAGQYVDAILAKVQAVANAISSLLGGGGTAAAVATGAAIPGAAAGGLQQGPGTGTSDSLLRRLSTGEYVVKARAVKYWGVSVLRAINNMISPQGYAAGGYVDSLGGAMAPASRAGGGLSAYQAAGGLEGRVSVDLTHNGSIFRDLLAPAAVAASLVRYASSQQRVSLGRRSTAYGAASS